MTKSKLRSDCVLASLTPAQLDDLYDLISSHSYTDVQEIAAKPVEEGGFGLKIHRVTLWRFYKKEQSERHALELAELAGSSDPGAALPADIQRLRNAVNIELANATYHLAKAAHEPATFDRVQRAAAHFDNIEVKRQLVDLQSRELDLARQRLELDKRNAEFNIARELMVKAPEYMALYSQTNLDNEDKIWKARQLCFGTPDDPRPARAEANPPAAGPLPADPSAGPAAQAALPPATAPEPSAPAQSAPQPDRVASAQQPLAASPAAPLSPAPALHPLTLVNALDAEPPSIPSANPPSNSSAEGASAAASMS